MFLWYFHGARPSRPDHNDTRRRTPMIRKRAALVSPLALLVSALAFCTLLLLPASSAQTPPERAAASRIVGEVFTQGRQLDYVSALSDRIGSRLAGTANERRADEWAEGEMKRLGLANVHRES